MGLDQIAVFVVLGLVYALVIPSKWRGWVLFIGSVIAIYWLQPTLNIRWLDYSLPTATLVVTIMCWVMTRKSDEGRVTSDEVKARAEARASDEGRGRRETSNFTPEPSVGAQYIAPLQTDNTNHPSESSGCRSLHLGGSFSFEDIIAFGVIVIIVLLLTVPRYVTVPFALTSRPPEVLSVVLALIAASIFTLMLARLPMRIGLTLIGLMVLFVVIKTAPLATIFSGWLRSQSGQDVTLASLLDLEWLGFSYLAFRLIHTLRDRQTGLLPVLTLREYVTYVVFFPAYTAGPIDRVERFSEDLRGLVNLNGRDSARLADAAGRIALGLFKKFVIADSLAVFSLSATTAAQAQSGGALWVMLYAYALRLLFDFSGYTDIAIGIGKLYGVTLPENFNRPYLKNHLAAFWQSWHITLSTWARAYVYAPLSRSLLRQKRKPSNDVIILLCNLATMSVIGLWHGVTLPFLVWGVWHGVGLTAHKFWSDRTRAWYRGLGAFPRRKQAWTLFGILLTFHFVLLGWVWFALPEMNTAVNVFLRLFGIN